MDGTAKAADSRLPANAGGAEAAADVSVQVARGETLAASEGISGDVVAEALAAVVELVTAWSSTELQARIARRIGLDINEADIRTLHTIGRLGGATRPALLADELHLTRPTMSKSLSRLAAAGLTERRAAADDGRSAEIMLTPDGRRAYARLVDAGVEMVRAALDASPGADAETLSRFARALRGVG